MHSLARVFSQSRRKTPQTWLSALPSSKSGAAVSFDAGKRHGTVIAPQPLWFHSLSLCENAIAASYAEAVNQPHPIAGIDSAKPLLFSDDALSYASLRRAQPDENATAGRNLLA